MKAAGLNDLQYALGKTFVERINPMNPELAPLKIGTDVFTILDIATLLKVTNVSAARKLTELADAIDAKNVKDFYRRSTPYSMATSTERVGVTTLYVAFRLFASKGLDPHEWYARGQKEAVIGFQNYKKRELEHNARDRKAARKFRTTTGNARPNGNGHGRSSK